MTNKLKKSLATLLAASMVLSMMSTAAFADEPENEEIEVQPTVCEVCEQDPCVCEKDEVCETCGQLLTECEGHETEKEPETIPMTELVPATKVEESEDEETSGDDGIMLLADEVEQTEAEKLQAAINAVEDGVKTTITMTADIEDMTTAITVPATKVIVLDMGGHKITVSESFSGRAVENKGDLTVQGNGTIDASNSQSGYGAINNTGTLTIENGTFRGNSETNTGNIRNAGEDAVLVINDGTFDTSSTAVLNYDGLATLNGGTYTTHDHNCSSCGNNWSYVIRTYTDGNEGVYPRLYVNGGTYTGTQGAMSSSAGYIEINGGTFRTVKCANNHNSIFYTLYAAGEYGGVQCVINGGTFETEGKNTAVLLGNDNTNGDGGINADVMSHVNGGTFIAPEGVPALKVSPNTAKASILHGGTYSLLSADTAEYVDPAVRGEAGNNVTLEKRAETDSDAVAKIGTAVYASLQDAIDAAEDGDVVTLVNDTEEKVTVSTGEITLDLKGKKISNRDNFTFSNNNFDVFFGAITVTGGKLTIDDTSAEKTGQVLGDAFAVVVKDGLLTVNNGSFGYASEESEWWEPLLVGGGSAVINDGFFFGGTLEYFYCYPGAAEGSLLVNGGRFDALPLYIAANQGAPIWAPDAEGYVVAYKTYGDFAADNAASFTYDSANNVLQMTSAYNKSATRTDPLSGFFINGDVILDLNGQTWTMENANLIVVNENTTLTVRDSAGNGVIENKTEVVIETLGTLNIEGGTLSTAQTYKNVIAANGNCTINITGGKLEGKQYGIISKGVTAGREDRTINISGGEFSTDRGFFSKAWNEGGAATVAVSGGTFKVQPAEEYIAEGLEAKQGEDSQWIVGPALNMVAQIVGGGAYDSLQAAIDAAQAGDTVKLLVNEIDLGTDNGIVLNKKLTIQGGTERTVIKGIGVADYANGLITLTGGSEGSVLENLTLEYTATGAQRAAVYFDGGFTGGSTANVTKLTNVTIDGVSSNAFGISSTYITGGYVEISGCTLQNLKYGMYFNAIHDLTVTGNTITNTVYNAINLAGDSASYPSSNITITGNTLTGISSGNYEYDEYSSGIRVGLNVSDVTLSGNSITMLNDKKDVYYDAAAEVNGVYYATLAEAIAAAQENDTVKLLKDVEITEGILISRKNDITLNGGNHTITVLDNAEIHAIQVWASTGVKIENITITGAGKDALLVNGGSTVTAENFNTFDNAWGAINVDRASTLDFKSGNLAEENKIWADNGNGTCTITVPESWNSYTDSKGQTFYTNALTLTLNQTTASLYSNTAPRTVTLTAAVEGLLEGKEVERTWTTDDAAIATVADGVVTAVANGTATITATVGSMTATCTVTVSTYTAPYIPPYVPPTPDEELDENDTPLVERPWIFVDVLEKDWFYGDVKTMFDKGVIGGMSETTYEPYTNATRAMVATLLYRMAGAPSVAELETTIADVTADDWFHDAALWAYANGVFGGYDDGTFRGGKNISREELAAVLSRYAAAQGLDVTAGADLSSFADAESVSDWAVSTMKWAVAVGLINGREGSLAAWDFANRAELATMLVRFDSLLTADKD